MQPLIKVLTAVAALSLCLPVAADEIERSKPEWLTLRTEARDEIERSNPEWSALIIEARRLWYTGDFAAGNALVLEALELARQSSEPLTLARSLEMAAQANADPEPRMKLLKEAYEIKETARGPRYVGLADTLLLMGSAAGTLAANAAREAEPGSDPNPATYQPAARKLYQQARSILLEGHGGGCEVGKADKFIAMTYERIDPSKAERIYREILGYCPLDPEDHEWKKSSTSAVVHLANLLRAQGRETEADELPELPEFIARDYGEPSSGFERQTGGDVFNSRAPDG